ncbi:MULTISPECIES: transglutaminase-like domain-containing protein [Rufibacter]|uniref:Regulator of sirC expression with transglutaminase-like and TPR domain n=1 Tax=Rufibacter quisquiliarum TaxID=1549639 RepID=A0A839GMM0_9BACT|nr:MULTISPECIES: transglutaminase-like domain-containing protein [Rufibacter]MBA9076795.1 regulator of sirC expression with transglutaminase-like and TPR domain [Rufibacter quisquiliarum]
MTNKEIKALISLLDDEDPDVVAHVQGKIVELGETIIPFLEESWEESLNPDYQKKLEDLIHDLQYEALRRRMKAWKEEGATDLLHGMWLVNTYQYPDVTLEQLNQRLAELYYEAWVHVKEDMHPYDQVKALNHVLFKLHHFSANTKNFHAPANSMLNQVLESKRGNPLSLCVIYLNLAQRLGLPVYGVNLPNLFVLTFKGDILPQFYINVYNRGLILTKADIDNYILQLNLNPVDIFYEPCAPIDIVRRALRNLSLSFEKLNDPEKAVEIEKLLEVLSDDPVASASEEKDPSEGEDETGDEDFKEGDDW